MPSNAFATPAGASPPSPCIGVCTLDDARICLGCRRTLAEIAAWARLSAEEQRRIIAELPGRGPD